MIKTMSRMAAMVVVGVVGIGSAAAAESFTVLVYETPATIEGRFIEGEPNLDYWNEFNALAGVFAAEGVLCGGTALRPDATVRRVVLRDGAVTMRDGSRIGGRLRLGGYFTLEVESIEALEEILARAPLSGRVELEIRPAQENPTVPMGME